MTRPRVGALFAGYGGIELAMHDVFGAEPAWFSEFDAAPSRILAHHWPDVPNLGDVTRIKWSPDCPECGRLTSLYWVGEDAHRAYWCREHGEFPLSLRDDEMARTGVPIAEPVDIITGGSPCQDLSHAGKRAGMRAGTRSGLWASMCDGIDIIRPGLVVWENVRGALSATADSAVEPCPICVGDGRGVTLRALGRVLGDLAELGYDAAWCGLRAADVGAPHGRYRVFVLAWPAADADDDRRGQQLAWGSDEEDPRPADAASAAGTVWGSREWRELNLLPTPVTQPSTGNGHARNLGSEARALLLPTPTASDTNGAGAHGDGGLDLRTAVSLLPTPVVNDMGASYTPETWDEWTARLKASHGNGNGASLSIEAQRPAFGQYAPAIDRWSSLTRPAPAPTEPTGKGGAHRLSPDFVEWMQGLPDGWVTDPSIGISRNDQLKALGNGVVPQQCAAAVRHLLGVRDHVAREAAA